MKDGPARVLEALRRAGGKPCSGEALSELQGVSRAQIWKDVESLRADGYAIEAAPGGGYRFVGAPDRLYPEEILHGLETKWLARDIRYHDTTDSTNRVALELARAGAAHGTTVIAEGQTAGRGRLGRSFFSPPYLNLYTSILLRPQITAGRAPLMTLAAATAVAETVADSLPDPDDVEIKWPNDVLVGGHKASGILMEMGAEAARVAFLVLGIGVNLNVEREAFPDEFRAHVTSLRSHAGRPIDRTDFARRLYNALEATLDGCATAGFQSVRPRFEARFRMRGRRVRAVELDGDEISGTAVGIDEDGALRVKPDRGDEVRVIAGDVTLMKEGT